MYFPIKYQLLFYMIWKVLLFYFINYKDSKDNEPSFDKKGVKNDN